MSFLRLFRKKQENEASRLARLAINGRIAGGSVIDVKFDDNNHITHVFYSYIIAGVEYESLQELRTKGIRPTATHLGSGQWAVAVNADSCHEFELCW